MRAQDDERAVLIGPDLFGPYAATLRVALLGIGAAAVVVGLERLAEPAGGLLGPLLAMARVWIQGAFVTFGTVTLMFALVQRSPTARARVEKRWSRLQARA